MPVSFRLGQGPLSSWEWPWKFSCSKMMIWREWERVRPWEEREVSSQLREPRGCGPPPLRFRTGVKRE